MRGSEKPLPGSDAPTLVPENSGTIAPTLTPVPQSRDAETFAGVPNAPQPSESAAGSGLQPGFVLGGRYEILAALGEGGMGAVYKARDRELDRLVALKVIRPDLARNPAIIQRFKQELILARQITQRNVVRIFDLGEAAGIKFITMEYVEGQDLHSLLHEHKTFAPKDAVEIILQVCRALEAAHGEGIIHRDLKPQNIMQNKQGRIVVMDFGLARTVEAAGMTQTGALVGTMDYMSPEQALGKDLDQRSDLFALGLIFYELLTGKMPYKAESVVASLLKRTQERAVPVLTHDPTIPTILSNVVGKCLERDLNLRYQTSSQILADLEAWQGGRAAATLQFPTGARPWGQTIPWHWIGGVAAVLVLAIVGFLFRDKLFRPAVRTPSGQVVSLAILPFRNGSGDSSLNWLGTTVPAMLRTDIGESAYLRTVPSDRVNQILHDLRIEPDASLDPDTLRRVADFTSADRLLWGQYIKLGDQIRIDATLQDLKQQRNFALKAEAANEKELPKALQQLAESVEKSLALPPETIKELQAKSLKPSSQSVQALRYYAEGMQLARQGKNLDAVKQFEASTKEDPNFALAYSKLGGAYAALGYGDKAQEFSRKAVDLSDKVSPQEKYLIAAIHAQTSNDSQKAIQAYENLAKILPDDSDVQSALARLYEDARSADKARGFYNRLLARDKNDVDALLGIGRVELYNDNAQGSLDYFNRALALAVQLENDEAKGAALFHIGDAYWLLNKPNDALRNYRESLAIRRRLADKRGTGLTLQGMGVSQLSLGQWNQALKSYREALSLLREIGDKRNIALTLLNLGSLYENRGQYDDALSATKESLQIQREVGDPMNEAACLNNIGVFYEDKGDYENAVTYFQQALQLNEKLRNSTGTAEVLDSLGEAFSKMGQYDQAVNYYLRALDLFRKANDMRGVGVESYGLGTLSAYQGRFGAALSYEADALKDFRQIKEGGLWLAKAQASYGNALTLIGRGDEAQKSLDEALGLARELKSDPLIVQILNFQGDRFFYRGDFKSAKSLFEQAVQVATRSKDRGKVLISRANLAKLAVKERRFGQAITQLKGLAEDADKSGLKYNSLECSIYLAEALVYSRDYLRARQVLDRSLATSEKLTLRILLARGHYLLATLLSQTGQSGEAASRFAQTSQILDEVRKEAGDSVLKRSDLAPLYAESARSQVPKK